ncbi:anti-phage dCTP deaminase [Sulfitobacter pontiacus]
MRPELVFGLVGPIGVDMDLVQERLCSSLKSVGYHPETIHLTKVMEQRFPSPPTVKDDLAISYSEKINRANNLRQAISDDVMATLAIAEIRALRKKRHEDLGSTELFDPANESAPDTAYIIRQLKHPAEIKALKKVYGEKFVQISVALDEQTRVRNLANRFGMEASGISPVECETIARELVATDNNEKSHPHGQRISKIYPLADAFIGGRNSETVKRTTQRFIEAFFGKNSIGPTKDEFGAYLAKAAALRSIDPARQVGAAILSADGDLITVGCNEVPKFGGGNYWSDEDNPQRDMEVQTESNKVETKRIIHDFLKRLEENQLLAAGRSVNELFSSDELKEALDGSKIESITEFGRMTHAEMSAITDAARLGRQVSDATLHVTTFPCHNCAKHIIASGIKRVVYIEPYDKSRASDLHDDALNVGEAKPGRVTLQHFEGISPRRYRNIFEKESRRNKDGSLSEWYEGSAKPRIADNHPFYLSLEAAYIKTSLEGLVDKSENLEP